MEDHRQIRDVAHLLGAVVVGLARTVTAACSPHRAVAAYLDQQQSPMSEGRPAALHELRAHDEADVREGSTECLDPHPRIVAPAEDRRGEDGGDRMSRQARDHRHRAE
jgi:hypothetical protein